MEKGPAKIFPVPSFGVEYPKERIRLFMNEKTLVIALAVLLGLGFVGVLFVIVPWFGSHGVSNWKQVLMDDGLILACVALFVYGFYMNTKMH